MLRVRARGDHHRNSDYNIAVFIKDPGSLSAERDRRKPRTG